MYSYGHEHGCLLSIIFTTLSNLCSEPLAVSLGGIVTLVANKILGLVVLTSGEVALEDSLGASCVADLGVDRGTGHVRNHCVSSAPCAVRRGTERVVGRGWLREPDITTVAAKLSGLEGLGDILLDDNGATGGVDEP